MRRLGGPMPWSSYPELGKDQSIQGYEGLSGLEVNSTALCLLFVELIVLLPWR